MILRQAPRGGFVTLPNTLLRHPDLSLDTKGMLAVVNSLPPDWEIKTDWLARELSCKGGLKIGRDRLRRMFAEAIAAGFMARSAERTHSETGHFGSYVYIVGADPADVRKAIAEHHHIEFLPTLAQPTLAQPTLAQPPQDKRHKETNDRIYKGGGEQAKIFIGDEATRLSHELLGIVGLDYAFLPPSWCGFGLHLQSWISAGASADVIRVAFAKVMAKRETPPDTPLYFAKAIARERALIEQPFPKSKGGAHGAGKNSVAEAAEKLRAEFRSKDAAQSLG